MIGFYYRLNREERRRRSGKTHIDFSQMHGKTKNRDQRICYGNEMHSKNAFIHNVCKCINWRKFTEFVSGMWELFRSLGFTSTSLCPCVCVFFFTSPETRYSHCCCFPSLLIEWWFSSCTKQTKMFLIIFCSRAFSLRFTPRTLHSFSFVRNALVWITITPFAWMPIEKRWFFCNSHFDIVRSRDARHQFVWEANFSAHRLIYRAVTTI